MPNPEGIIAASSAVAHRQTTRTDEYVGYDAVHPDPNEPVEGYTLATAQVNHYPGQAVPQLPNAFDQSLESPPNAVTLLPADSSNPLGEEEVVAEYNNVRHTMYHSRRGCMVTRWLTELLDYGISESWLLRQATAGLGSSINPNDRWLESVGEAGVNMHNPTTGGTGIRPFPANTDIKTLLTSLPLYHSNSGGGPGVAYAASGCLPLQWDGDGTAESPHTNHSGTATRAAAWWRRPFFHKIEPFFGGRPYIQRITSWSFVPRDHDQSEFGGTVTLSGSGTAKFRYDINLPVGMAAIFDEAYFYDCATSILTRLPEWNDTPDPGLGTISGYINTTRYLHYIEGPDTDSKFPSGYAAVILRRIENDFTVALAVKIGEPPNKNGKISRYMLPNSISVINYKPGIVWTPDIGGDASHAFGVDVESFFGRHVGWHGLVCYKFTGLWNQCVTALKELYTSGLLDERPDMSIIPEEVWARTELAVGNMEGTIAASSSTSVLKVQAGPSSPESLVGGVMRIPNAVAVDHLDRFCKALAGGYIEVYSGPVPLDLDAPAVGVTRLGTLTFSDPAFGPATDADPGAQAIAYPITPELDAEASGFITFMRLWKADGTLHCQLTAGTQGSGADVELETNEVKNGGPIILDTLVLFFDEVFRE